MKIIYEVRACKELDEPHFGLIIRNNLGLSIFETNTYCMKIKTKKILKDQISLVEWTMQFPLSAGTYSFSIGVANKGYDDTSFKEILLLIHDITIIHVLSNSSSIKYGGIFNIKPTVTIS